MRWSKGLSSNGRIGLVAGQGAFPLIFAQAAASLKKELVVFGVENYTDKRIEEFAVETHYVPMGAFGVFIDLLKRSGVKQIVLAGGMPKKEIYNPQSGLDETIKGVMRLTPNKGDDHLLKALALFVKTRCGVSVIDSRAFLKDTLAPKGVMTRLEPTSKEWEDLRFGWHIAKDIGRLDIGQTVIVKDGLVLAVEALEGTDAAIKRAGALAGCGAIMVKVSKPKQDLRFDLPCVGLETLESLKAAGSRVLGVEAGKTLILFKDKVVQSAEAAGITIVGL